MSSNLGVHLVYGMFVCDLPDNAEFYYEDGDEIDACDKLSILEEYGIDCILMYDGDEIEYRLVGHQIKSDTDWCVIEINEQMIKKGKEFGLLKWQELYPDITHEDLKLYISPSYY